MRSTLDGANETEGLMLGGMVIGWVVGIAEIDGFEDALRDGLADTSTSSLLGLSLGPLDGKAETFADGLEETLGNWESMKEGIIEFVGLVLGCLDGIGAEGRSEGCDVGKIEG
mmetsp:Transcript_32120/g.58846  ORF Transcript_32120/g.58846 Transcript_32120/m.58846 type:complete len:113 (-) Transcript_32120:366-704(-)